MTDCADLADAVGAGFEWARPDGIVLRANQAELDMLGYGREEYVGRPIADCGLAMSRRTFANIANLFLRCRCSGRMTAGNSKCVATTIQNTLTGSRKSCVAIRICGDRPFACPINSWPRQFWGTGSIFSSI